MMLCCRIVFQPPGVLGGSMGIPLPCITWDEKLDRLVSVTSGLNARRDLTRLIFLVDRCFFISDIINK